MMATLLKHEWRGTRALLGTVMAAATLLAGAGTLLAATGWPVLTGFGTFIALVGVISPVPVLQIALVVLYWRSSYSKTGYFTHSIPVRGGTIYAAKLLWTAVVSVVGVLLSFVLGLAFWPVGAATVGAERNPFTMLGDMWSAVTSAASPGLLIAGLLLALGLLMMSPIQLFFAASVGAESPLNRWGLAGPLLVYVGLYVVFQIVVFAGLLLIPWGFAGADGQLSMVTFNVIEEVRAGSGNSDVMPLGFLPPLFLVTLACLWRTVVSWNRKVSLV
ncbi:hypothetical protein EDD31_0201 [Bogoriella caseilytica]|uniref:ABC-2 family transporter n=2 Tax=Bogoriella caseilytica TaxID=56055 RepID=A0A3N2B9B5_9MICO|nr:hypothetical protein EDD31_0201 [Bogoriella caseilytica]